MSLVDQKLEVNFPENRKKSFLKKIGHLWGKRKNDDDHQQKKSSVNNLINFFSVIENLSQ